MENGTYLNEERYQKVNKKISGIALIILIIGLLIGGSLITVGVIKRSEVNSTYSSETKEKLQKEIDAERVNLESKKAELEGKRAEQLNTERQNLESKKAELIAKGLTYNAAVTYDDGESYDLYVITKALDPSFDYCAFDECKNNTLTSAYCLLVNKSDENSKDIAIINEALNTGSDRCTFDDIKNNSYTSKYCSLKAELSKKTDFNKSFDLHDSTPLFMFGGFAIFASFIISGAIFMSTKRREILAYQAQQIMPVAQEGMEQMAPTIGKVGATIVKEAAPVAGEVAKEIAKGIKEEDNK